MCLGRYLRELEKTGRRPYAVHRTLPDVAALVLAPQLDTFAIHASDRLWGVVGDQEAVDLATVVIDKYAAKLREAKRSIKAAAYWSIFDVLLVNGIVNLVCTVCNKSYSAKNPSAVCPDHYAKHQKDVASTVGSEQSGAPTTNSTKRSRAEEGPVRTFFLAAVQIATFLKHLALFFFKCNIALHLIEHPDLITRGA
ncbi:hypothetical protein VOLCADRAFT_98235 [Volvox carteri f. nagariensis]|uniref:PPM-type phosphatase domain-containing protein n=1 Tax=Volvox carteri f. nagariensis TaxID=3068 RepID=D8UES9_VOLCA|nr:uncharacterized protein VOLCADRAFT_98235 [Volvox carteri f. nagariensis]EFJ41784.1 hypothetical protein VOLCADRAFT_98235 [Volvox carteri f. nagariensis]|eukprot:XP_002957130.1 hypothetical protein VOLCADRAFT_98235 [Volvox carteri f. nagariensis]